jgi:hypothetical protein
MRIRLLAALLAFCSCLGFAQNQAAENLCSPASATTIDHDEGVTVQKVTLSGKWGSSEAVVYLPDKETADGAIVFSHSAISSEAGSLDLMPLAFTLAHAGAAVIVSERTLIWPPRDQWMNREGGAVICAEHWLIDHTRVFNDGNGATKTVKGKNVAVREGYAYIGPALCSPSDSFICERTTPFSFDDCGYTRYCRTSVVAIPLGEIVGDNTNRVLSTGGLKEAQWLQQHLGLAAIGTIVRRGAASGS